MSIPDAITVRRVGGGSGRSEAEINELINNAIALRLRTIENVESYQLAPEENAILFVDSHASPELNGVYGYQMGREWKRLGIL